MDLSLLLNPSAAAKKEIEQEQIIVVVDESPPQVKPPVQKEPTKRRRRTRRLESEESLSATASRVGYSYQCEKLPLRRVPRGFNVDRDSEHLFSRLTNSDIEADQKKLSANIAEHARSIADLREETEWILLDKNIHDRLDSDISIARGKREHKPSERFLMAICDANNNYRKDKEDGCMSPKSTDGPEPLAKQRRSRSISPETVRKTKIPQSGNSPTAANEQKQKKRKSKKDLPVESSSDEELFEVLRISGKRKRKGVTEYLTLWKGYSIKEATWEPAHHFDTPAAIENFESVQEGRQKRRKQRC